MIMTVFMISTLTFNRSLSSFPQDQCSWWVGLGVMAILAGRRNALEASRSSVTMREPASLQMVSLVYWDGGIVK